MASTANAARPIAWRGSVPVDERTFRARVAGWTTAFAARDGAAVALYELDGVEFVAALLGAWQSGKVVYLPGDNLPTTGHQLATLVQLFAGAWPVERAPLVAPMDGSPAMAFRSLDAEFVGVIVFTSGSTGDQQAIPKRLGQLAEEVETLDRTFGSDVGDATFVATVSHQHIYGLLFKILWPLASGRTFLSASVTFPGEVAAALTGRRAALVSSPAFLKRLPTATAWSGARVGLGAVFSSGGPLPAHAALLAEQLLGQSPIEVLGSSETGGIATRRQVGGADAPWTPLPGVAVRVESGHLSVQSRHLADHAWLDTADMATLADDGTFALVGRADRIAKVEGKRVSLSAIERALVASQWATDARVFPLTDGREQLVAVVVPSATARAVLVREGKVAASLQLRALLAESTERVALPRRWRFVDALPINSQGKTTQAELTRLFATAAPTMPSAHVIEQAAAHAVLEFDIPANLTWFDGHFTNAPVLAGVVQVHWAIHYARQYFGVRGAFRRLEAIKFHRLIRPGMTVRMEIDWRADSAALIFSLVSSAGKHSSGRVVFAS